MAKFIAKIIAKILSSLFGPTNKADARHMAEFQARQNEPLAQFINQQPLVTIHNNSSVTEIGADGLKEYETFQTAKPLPAFAPTVSKKQAILNYIKLHGQNGITAESVGKAFPAWRYSTITARISELYKSGLIVAVGQANTGSGSLASLFAVAK